MANTADHEQFRTRVLKSLTDELLGPEPEDNDSRQRELLDVSPLQLYATGVLFPQNSHAEQREDDGTTEVSDDPGEDSSEADKPEIEVDQGERDTPESTEIEEQPLNLANEFNPSAAGITVRVPARVILTVEIHAARYEGEKHEVPNRKAGQLKPDGSVHPETLPKLYYRRIPIHDTVSVNVGSEPARSEPVTIANTDESLKLHVRIRSAANGLMTVSLALVNHRMAPGLAAPPFNAAFFQSRITVRDTENRSIFHPIDRAGGVSDDHELASLDLLYRSKRSFALGHGCGANWTVSKDNAARAVEVHSEFIPKYDLKPVRPREKPFGSGIFELSMHRLAESGIDQGSNLDVLAQLNALADDYEAWIKFSASTTKDLEDEYQEPAARHLANCRSCLARIREGIRHLADHEDAMLAFRLTNRAMLIQQIRTRLPDREPDQMFKELPDDYHIDDGLGPTWRPFQLAFILMNIACCSEPTHADRRICDLIWFPTGGGKTEAYLGLAAFCICLRRLRNSNDRGTEVLMRYTLRLLTAQQFQRAAALITALETLRQDACYGANLGDHPITIGLWVGMGLTPNRRDDALKRLNQLRGSDSARNPFQLLRCPWCRTSLDCQHNLGYDNEPFTSGGTDSVVFRCPNEGCRWHYHTSRLPVVVIDDDIYDAPPTLLLGTVDKFAQLAWEPRTGRLFGVGVEWEPPGLIIQDELHLISGPLGTIVGLYETIIEELCKVEGGSAKLVASTATIRESGKQCQGLYARERFEFPPQGLYAGDSYFAYEDSDAPGRLYVGVFGAAVKSHATAQVRVVSPLLQSVMPLPGEEEYDSEIADGYSTVLWYFNSLRELGHAVTMCTGDIPEHHFNLCRRLDVERERRRLIRNIQELTSRRTADEIPRILDDLNRRWTPELSPVWPVDVLLATNMVSVGVDVPRLGLMVVTGQPKSTSEYIQATSRVGRSFPGMVVTVYNPARSRDRSHYEQFVGYHQAIYRHVEPTSVTPFSAPARSRGFAGLVIAMARLMAGVEAPDRIGEYRDRLDRITAALLDRVALVDEPESEDAEREIKEIFRRWEATAPPEFGRMAGIPDTQTLMYPYGRRPDENLELEAFPVLTSMRNVDITCVARVLSTYPDPQG